ncbi:uncharacterized protein A1O5_04345 [Cladophialophora psammophila CBS 110553]|uniref:FAD-binding domain-containing protein n=1 Tax=Cladophialophora psammophila CBS 110553 TaxID=1182543 RepID=W9XNE1_9EURO|nr:uncharacterized protein A1O5_04345 [Cladophialophora psammophila CBS 110553]EXJ71844.1 hypothetical protein A1O5_04345 [Cladophialophora psammophila CBS 110553]
MGSMSEHDWALDGLRVIVIGAGFGGLASAIALSKRGASVTVYESYPDMTKQGDVIMMGSNATVLLKRWGNVLPEIMKASSLPSHMNLITKEGKLILAQKLPSEFHGNPNVYTARGGAQAVFYEYAKSLGVDVVFGARVSEIYETADAAGIVANGVKHEADCIVAADGVHSKARGFVTGIPDRPKKSGFAVYRSWFPMSRLLENPLTKPLAESENPIFKIWISEDIHAICTTNPSLQRATCFVTHKANVKEDWNLPGNIDDMRRCVEGWDPQLLAAVNCIPEDCLIDYKLLWRDPVRKWISDGGRIALVGDAAHPHLPTSGTGGSQAIEDGTTIAVLLARTWANRDIPLAFRAFERLRYERTSLTQRMGWETRHVWHQTDWEAVAKNPELLSLPQPEWLNGCDAEKYAEDKFDAVISHLQKGTPFESTNVPPGHVHEDWTIDQMLAFEGKKVDKDFYKTR